MEKWINENLSKFSGSIFVSRGTEVLIDNGYGYSDKENKINNTSDTKFMIGSISKVFTAVGVMKLYEEGMLDINDSVNKYLDISSLEDEIKIKHLLSHTSGLKNFVMCRKEFDLKKDNKAIYVAEKICSMKRKFNAGEKFSYNNTGYLMLALIIEKVTATKFEEYIRTSLFSDLGMNSSYFITDYVEKMAKGYNKGKEEEQFHKSAFFGAGDIISTTNDLKRFMDALLNGRLIKRELVDMMETVQGKGAMFNYGYGLIISDKLGEKSIGHSGNVPNSFASQIIYYKESDITIIVLANDVVSVKSFVPSVVIAQYVEKSIYEKIQGRKIKFINKVI